MSLKKAYDHWLFREYHCSNEGLALYRIFFALMALFVIGYPDLTWMAELSDFYYQPQPLNLTAFLFQRIPSYAVLFLLSFLPFVCLVAILIGFQTRYFALAFGLLILLGMGLKASLGKIDHGVLFPLTAMIMAFSGWDEKYAMGPKKVREKKRDGFPQWLVAFVIALAMLGAGYLKWKSGWLEASQVGVLHHFLNSYMVWDRTALLAPWVLEVRSVVFWQVLDILTVAFEMLFIVAALKKSWFQKYLIVALAFHTTVFLLLNITIVNLFMAYALFLPWDRIHEEIRRSGRAPSGWVRKVKGIWAPLIVILILCGLAYYIYRTETETTIALFRILSFPFDWNYKWFQVVLIYGLGYLVVFRLWRQKA